jgi:hypothetical protein
MSLYRLSNARRFLEAEALISPTLKVLNTCPGSSILFCIILYQGCTKFFRNKNKMHLKILGAISVTRRKFHTEKVKILGANVKIQSPR